MKNFGLVVIGAHFGVWLNDDISQFSDKEILLVEPVPYNYNKLKKNLKDSSNIHICTNAIFSEHKKSKFYYVNENSISKLGKHWASGIGSFNKSHILDHKTKRFKIEEEDVDEIEIEFITFDDLIRKFSIESIDKLQIDVEGAEYEILKSSTRTIAKFKPIFYCEVIRKRNKIIKFFKEKNYVLFKFHEKKLVTYSRKNFDGNLLAVHKKDKKKYHSLWAQCDENNL